MVHQVPAILLSTKNGVKVYNNLSTNFQICSYLKKNSDDDFVSKLMDLC